jgi:ferric-dicitrate binding protein FerR (iron transport regulator)
MTREILTLELLRRMGKDRAAALLIVRRNADDYDGEDEAVLDDWLAANPEHPEAWARASTVCAHFDIADDDPMLRAMRDALLNWTPKQS